MVILWNRFYASGCKAFQGFYKKFGTAYRQAVMQRGGRIFRKDGFFLAEQDVSGVNPLVHQHGGDAGLRLCINDGPLDRCRAAVFWK